MEVTPRLPKFKNCKHDYRYIRTLKGLDVFYCTKCLLSCAKLPDFTKKQIVEQYQKYKNEINKR